MTVTTPTARAAFRSARFWIVSAVFALVVAVAAIALTGAGGSAGTPLSAGSAAPDGSMAIAEVLRKQGVTVVEADSLAAARAAVSRVADTTILVVDDEGYLGGTQLRELARLSGHLVLMTPDFAQLESAAPELARAGAVEGELGADCELPPVRRAATVTGTGSGYRVISPEADAVSCLGSGDGVHSLIQLERGDRRLTVLGTREAFANEHVAEHGNAALALGLLGQTRQLVWLLPSIDEAAGAGASIADLTPAWVSAVMALLVIAAIAGAAWRARRLGPLVIENLPVTVRASETMEGRARLYQTSSARLRALDALRIGSIGRLAALCGLPRTASVDEVAQAVSSATGGALRQLTALLRDAEPASDAELVLLSDELLSLERATRAALRPDAAASPNDEPGEWSYDG